MPADQIGGECGRLGHRPLLFSRAPGHSRCHELKHGDKDWSTDEDGQPQRHVDDQQRDGGGNDRCQRGRDAREQVQEPRRLFGIGTGNGE